MFTYKRVPLPENGSGCARAARLFDKTGVAHNIVVVDTELPSGGNYRLRPCCEWRPVGGPGRESLRPGQRGRHRHFRKGGNPIPTDALNGRLCYVGPAGHHREIGQ